MKSDQNNNIEFKNISKVQTPSKSKIVRNCSNNIVRFVQVTLDLFETSRVLVCNLPHPNPQRNVTHATKTQRSFQTVWNQICESTDWRAKPLGKFCICAPAQSQSNFAPNLVLKQLQPHNYEDFIQSFKVVLIRDRNNLLTDESVPNRYHQCVQFRVLHALHTKIQSTVVGCLAKQQCCL